MNVWETCSSSVSSRHICTFGQKFLGFFCSESVAEFQSLKISHRFRPDPTKASSIHHCKLPVRHQIQCGFKPQDNINLRFVFVGRVLNVWVVKSWLVSSEKNKSFRCLIYPRKVPKKFGQFIIFTSDTKSTSENSQEMSKVHFFFVAPHFRSYAKPHSSEILFVMSLTSLISPPPSVRLSIEHYSATTMFV